MRRSPVQDRSRERVERILRVATGLIAEGGSDRMRMSEVAKRARIPIGSLYQYFPDKGAVLRTLADRFNVEDRACIEAALTPVHDRAGLVAAFTGLVDVYYELYLAEPVRRDVWSGIQADQALLAEDVEEHRVGATLLAAAMRRAGVPDAKAFLLWYLAGAAVRCAITLPPAEGAKLIAELKEMVARELEAE